MTKYEADYWMRYLEAVPAYPQNFSKRIEIYEKLLDYLNDLAKDRDE